LVEHSVAVEVPFSPRCGLAGLVLSRLKYLDDIQLVEYSVLVGVTGDRLRIVPDSIILVKVSACLGGFRRFAFFRLKSFAIGR
jgi:hypothetical protein